MLEIKERRIWEGGGQDEFSDNRLCLMGREKKEDGEREDK